MLSAVTQIEIVALNYARCKRGLAEVRPTVGRPDPRRGPRARPANQGCGASAPSRVGFGGPRVRVRVGGTNCNVFRVGTAPLAAPWAS